MAINMIKMSSRGQVVIPRSIREAVNASEGTIFAVVSGENSVILKKIETPSKEDLIRDIKEIARKGEIKSKNLGIKESDVSNLVHKLRKNKRK